MCGLLVDIEWDESFASDLRDLFQDKREDFLSTDSVPEALPELESGP